MKLIEDLELYSDLLLSVGTHAGERPLEPIEVAKLIDRLKNELSENYSQISTRLGFKDVTQTKNFLKLLNLPETVHYSLGWMASKDEKIPFTNGAIFAELDNEQDMEYLVKIGIEYKIKKSEAIRIVQLKKQSPHKSIEECVDDVLRIRPVIIKGYLVINTIQDDTLSKLNALSNKEKMPINHIILDTVNIALGKGKAENVLLKKNTIYLTLDEEGYKSLLKKQVDNKLHLKDLLDFIIDQGLKHD